MHNRYHIFEKISQGSYGTVYSGYHKHIGKTIAVKVVKQNKSTDREVTILKDVQGCRNVVVYHDHVYEDGMYYIAMDVVSGCDGAHIRDLARKGTLLREEDIRAIAYGICEGVKDIHARGILYGDIKPANIIYTPPQTVTLVDFGSARRCDRHSGAIGTPLYCAPEKIYEEYGHKSDSWSIGVSLYEMACGHHPYTHAPLDIYELYHDLVSTRLTFHHPTWDIYSDTMKEFIKLLLHKDPNERIDVKDALSHPWFV